MRRNSGKHSVTTFVILASCLGLLAAALILDFLWASASSSSTTASVTTYMNFATNWNLEEPIWSEEKEKTEWICNAHFQFTRSVTETSNASAGRKCEGDILTDL
ncbi:hypothetical protein ACLOJK_012040 [Asimina triloba]